MTCLSNQRFVLSILTATGVEVLVDDKWVRTRMEMNPAREWYLVGTPYMGFGDKIRGELGEDKDGMLKRIYEYVKRFPVCDKEKK